MDGDEVERLREELVALRARVARLELRLEVGGEATPVAEGRLPVSAAVGGDSGPIATAPLSFTQPEKPSLESRIGSQVFNRVGIVALLIGVAWFLKYAFDQQWLGPAERVGVGLLAGLGVVGWSERFRRGGYPVFSYSLKAVGTGVLYLSLWAAYLVYHLLGYPAAFAGMVLVTVGNGWLCWRQRSEVLAAYVAIGGFLTPALLGGEQVPALGGYLLLLNAGLFTLMALRRWPRLLGAAFIGTGSYLLMFALDAGALLAEGQAGTAQGLAVLFFALFSTAPLLLRAFGAGREAAVLAVANAGLAWFELLRLQPDGSALTPWLPVGFAIWFAGLLFAELLSGRLRAPAGLAEAQGGLVVAFAALGCWTALPREGTVAGWGLEAALLLWLTLRERPAASGRVLASPVPAGLLLVGSALLLVGESVGGALRHPGHVLWNERFGLFLLLIAVAVMAVRVAARQHAAHREGVALGAWNRMAAGSAVLAAALLLLAGGFEIYTYWAVANSTARAVAEGTARAGAGGTAEQFSYSAWAGLLGLGLLGLGFRVRWAFLRWQALGLLTLAVGKVFVVDTRALSQGFRIVSFLGLGVVLLLVSFIYQRDLLNLRGREHGG